MTSNSDKDHPEKFPDSQNPSTGEETLQEEEFPSRDANREGERTIEMDDDGDSVDDSSEDSGTGQQTIVDDEQFGVHHRAGDQTLVEIPEGHSTDTPDDPGATYVSDDDLIPDDGGRTLEMSHEEPTADESRTLVDIDSAETDGLKTMVDDSQVGDDFDLSKTWGVEINAITDPGMTIRSAEIEQASAPGNHTIPRRELVESGKQEVARAEYQLLNILGEGGMGVVWEARQKAIERNVAIKMIKTRMAKKPKQVEKFIAEAVVTGDLAHPNIVPIHELGQDNNGNYFYAMKHVQGTPWNKVIRNKSLHENLDYLLRTCDAIAFAHARGIMHRDLKPENIMLGDFGEVLVMDWGLALPTEEFTKKDLICSTHGMGGTPAYMAPEMATGPLDRVGYSSDVYLLGAILYEIISGYPPHRGKTSQECLAAAMRNKIAPIEHHSELADIAFRAMALSPSDRYQTVKEFQGVIRDYLAHEKSLTLSDRATKELDKATTTRDYAQFARSVFGYEEAITLWPENEEAHQGLRTSRAAYATTALQKQDFDLAESLINDAEEENQDLLTRIRAAKQDRLTRKRMFQVAKGAVAVLAVAILVIIGTSYYLINEEYQKAVLAEKIAIEEKKEADKQRGIAQLERDNAEENRVLAVMAQKTAEEEEEKALAQKKIAEEQTIIAVEQRSVAEKARKEEQYKSYIASIGLAAAKVEENAFSDALSLLEACPPELRHWEWGRLMYLCSQSAANYPCDAPVDGLALSPDNTQMATASWDGQVRIWDVESEQVLHSMPHDGIYVHSVDWSPTANLIASGSNDKNGNLKFWNPATGESIGSFKAHTDDVVGVRFSDNGQWLMTCSYDNTAKLWNVIDNKEVQPVCTLRGHTWWVWDAAFIPGFEPQNKEKNRVVTVSQDGKAIVWEISADAHSAEPKIEYLEHNGPVYTVDYHPNGQAVATGGYDRTIQYWKPADIKAFDFGAAVNGEQVETQQHVTYSEHTGPVRSVRFSYDGELLTSGSQDNSIKVWDLKSTSAIKTFRGHDSAVRDCVMTQDGRSLLSCSEDQRAIRWSVDDYAEIQTLNGQELTGHRDAILSAQFSPNGQQVLTASRDRSAWLWNIQTGKPDVIFQEGHQYLSSSARFLKDERILATAAADNSVRFWNTSTGAEIVQFPSTGRSGLVAISSDETLMATGSEDDRILIWDLANILIDPQPLLKQELAGHQHPVTALCFVQGTHQLVSGDAHGRCIKWDSDSAEILWSKRDHTLKISEIRQSDNPPVLLTASHDRTIGVRSIETGEEIVSRVMKHNGPVISIDVSEDGKTVASVTAIPESKQESTSSTELSIWKLTEEKPAVKQFTLTGTVVNDIITADNGQVCYATCGNNTVQRIETETGRTELFIDGAEHGGLLWSSLVSQDGRRLLTIGGIDARLWDVSTRRERMSFGPHGAVASAAMNPNGKTIVTGSWDRSLKFWDVASGQSQRKITNAHQGYINDVEFSHDGRYFLSTGDDGLVILWDFVEAKEVLRIPADQSGINVAVFSPDDKQILTASRNRTLKLWNSENGKLIREFEKAHDWSILSARFSPDGTRVISGSEDNKAILWDTSTGKPVSELKGHTAAFTSVAYSVDGKRILTASRDNTAKLWDATAGNEGNEILTLKKHQQEVTAVDFSSNSLEVLTGSRDGTAIIWPAINWGMEQAELNVVIEE